MLIEFSVANYRSIKERQTLSLVPAAISSNRKNRFIHPTGFNAAPNVVETAAIYGPNGAGKSNLVLAMAFFRKFLIESAKESQEGESIEITPFLFSEKTQNKPSEFEIVFVHEGFLFQYGFSVDTKRVHEEWLYATPQTAAKQKAQRWFERDSKDIQGKNTHIMKELKGDKKVWQRLTRSNALFLSTAVSNNSEDFKKPFHWIQNYFNVIKTAENLSLNFTAQEIVKNGKKEAVLEFMKNMDASFEDIAVLEKEITKTDIHFPKGMPEAVKEKIAKGLLGKKGYEIFTTHKIEEGGSHLLEIEEESEGTRRLFAFAGPILEVLDKGEVLVVDEIHNSLHPHALKGILSLFQNKNINKKNAQLIFTTHDTTPMNFVERDQVWLMDKGDFGDTIITAVSEFEGRPDEAIEKRYLGGRYGALPNIRSFG